MTNRYRPHVMVLPQDDANSRLANGFLLRLGQSALAKTQVLPEVGGWSAVLDTFESIHVSGMDRFPGRFMVLVIDFDGRRERLQEAMARVPPRLTDRVFILGAWSEPEALRRSLGSYETIGLKLAQDCREETNTTWGHDLLRHNESELDRLRERVRPLLFPSI